MPSLKQRLSRAADRGLDDADDMIDRAREGKRRLERRYDNSELGDSIEDFAETTGRNLRHAYESGMDTLDDTTDTARDIIQRNPLLALAGAFVGGMFASMLLRK
jgi:hypothetical protein